MKKADNNYENDLFITLVKVAKEKSETGDLIRNILDLDDIKRTALINGVIGEMKKNNEEPKLIEAFLLLKDSGIVNKIKEIKL